SPACRRLHASGTTETPHQTRAPPVDGGHPPTLAHPQPRPPRTRRRRPPPPRPPDSLQKHRTHPRTSTRHPPHGRPHHTQLPPVPARSPVHRGPPVTAAPR